MSSMENSKVLRVESRRNFTRASNEKKENERRVSFQIPRITPPRRLSEAWSVINANHGLSPIGLPGKSAMRTPQTPRGITAEPASKNYDPTGTRESLKLKTAGFGRFRYGTRKGQGERSASLKIQGGKALRSRKLKINCTTFGIKLEAYEKLKLAEVGHLELGRLRTLTMKAGGYRKSLTAWELDNAHSRQRAAALGSWERIRGMWLSVVRHT
ncbi:hypothetical protein WH47_02141 [Habropoda laboriosa]|uniref:Uncharacterized protein n=1 Tax=Habropoda laboriosa TaxID=597456 RepID=A0A0L7RJ48_9HYME|nr:hypothetical protein WH47_02141 [Habropoda laboriosa]